MKEKQPTELSGLEILKATSLEIRSYQPHMVNLKFNSPMVLPFGEISVRPSGLLSLDVEVEGNRYDGFGEGVTLPDPLFTDDSGSNITKNINEILKTLGKGPFSLVDAAVIIRDARFADEGRYPTARMTVEMALIDAAAKSLHKNVGDLLGIEQQHKEVPYGKSISGRTTSETLDDVDQAIKSNARKIKLKISPKMHHDVISALSIISGNYPDIELMVDANGSYDPSNPEHQRYLAELDQLDLLMIEEPVSRSGETRGIEAVRLLRKNLPDLRTPICLDDCLTDSQTTFQAIDENLCEIVNIKPGRIGSIFEAITIADKCAKINKQVMVGGMFEATPGRIMTTVLAAYCNMLGFNIPGDLSLAQERLTEDLVPIDQQLTLGPNGGIMLPNKPGWGFEIKRGIFNHE